MAVAYFMAHAPRGFWPVLNRGEAAVLFCFLLFTWPRRAAARGAWTTLDPRVGVVYREAVCYIGSAPSLKYLA
jgi:hypothetical protein